MSEIVVVRAARPSKLSKTAKPATRRNRAAESADWAGQIVEFNGICRAGYQPVVDTRRHGLLIVHHVDPEGWYVCYPKGTVYDPYLLVTLPADEDRAWARLLAGARAWQDGDRPTRRWMAEPLTVATQPALWSAV